MTTDINKSKQALLGQVKSILAGRTSTGKAKQASYYAEAFFRRVPIEELSRETPVALAAIVSEQMDFISKRPANEAVISVFNPSLEDDGWDSQHTIIEMVNDDMPFLVDSANVVMAELNLGVHLMVHPVIHVERDSRGRVKSFYSTMEAKGKPESIIHMQIDRQNDPEMLAKIEAKLSSSMSAARLAVNDWKAMTLRLEEAARELPQWAHRSDPATIKECQEFLTWMKDDHFILLGTRDYKVLGVKGNRKLEIVDGSGLGLLQETDQSVRSRSFATLSEEARNNRSNPMIITKTRSRSNVHRVGYMDYIGVIRFDKKGKVAGERRFIGLFTSNAYFRRVTDTPLIRLKVKEVLERSLLRDKSHAQKSLVHILETLPRDDLFQASTEELVEIYVDNQWRFLAVV